MAHRGGYVVLGHYNSTSSSKVYEVRRGGDGVLYCTCRGWVASKSRPRKCTHTISYVDRNPGTVYELNNAAVMRREDLQKRKIEADRLTAVLAAEAKAARQRGVATPAAALKEYAREVEGRFARVEWSDDGRAVAVKEAENNRFSFLDILED